MDAPTKATPKNRKLSKQDRLLAERIRELRLERNLTQEELAGCLGVNASYIAYIETGRSCLSLSALYKLAKIFGIKVRQVIWVSPKAIFCGFAPATAHICSTQSSFSLEHIYVLTGKCLLCLVNLDFCHNLVL